MIELLLVVVVVGLLAAIAVPRLDVARYRVDGAVHATTTTFLAAQREAVSRQHNVLVVVDTAARALRVVWDVNNNERIDESERTRTVVLDEGVRFGLPTGATRRGGAGSGPFGSMATCGTERCVIFQRNGSADRTASFFLTSARALTTGDRPRDARQIEVTRASGRPQSWQFTGTAWQRVN